MFRKAIVRPPSSSFSQGLTSSDLGVPDLQKALIQHEAYCEALRSCGLELTTLKPDPRFPDSTFVEDTAVIAGAAAIMTNPGAESRKGEVAEIRNVLAAHFDRIYTIQSPGTVDGGDICEADGHFFIGISNRTNEDGAGQLAGYLAKEGYSSSNVDIRGIEQILHLKSGIAYLGEGNLALIEPFLGMNPFTGYNILRVVQDENYAANFIRVNDSVLVAEGYPKIVETIEGLGYQVKLLEMSEYQKMDGGLSCLSIRF